MPRPRLRWLLMTLLAGLMAVAHASDQGDLVLDLDTLEASMDGSTLHATEVAGAHVGAVDEDLFMAIVVGDEVDGTGSVRGYLCSYMGGVWLDGESNGDEVTLASDDGVYRFEGTLLGSGDIFGVVHLGDSERRPFTAAPARGDAGLYRAEAHVDSDDLTIGWVVLEDGRQRGPLDGKGNDPYPTDAN